MGVGVGGLVQMGLNRRSLRKGQVKDRAPVQPVYRTTHMNPPSAITPGTAGEIFTVLFLDVHTGAPMNLPEPYRRFYRTHLRFALIMLLFGLLLGISFQESTGKMPISEAVPAGMHLESIMALALVHGHAILIGVVMPLAALWALHIGLLLGAAPLSARSLKWTSALYIPGAVVSVLLMLWKGYHFVLGVRHGTLDLALLNHTFLFGSHALRAALYGASHTAMALGLGILGVGLWRSLNTESSEA